MVRKSLIFAVVACLIFSFTQLSWGQVWEKSFQVNETVKQKTSVRGAGSYTETGYYTNRFTFGVNGEGISVFSMDSMAGGSAASGEWSQNKRKYYVYLPDEVPEDFAYDYVYSNFEYALSQMGCGSYSLNVTDLVLTKYSFMVSESKYGDTMKGKFSFSVSFNLYLYCANLGSGSGTGKYALTDKFSGWLPSASPGAAAVSSVDPSSSGSFRDAIDELLSAPGGGAPR